jgi:citrate lyase beta subunit
MVAVMLRRRRSFLYLPGSSQHMMERASRRGADVLVLDLADGVHPDLKDEARERIRDAYPRYDWGDSEVVIRSNGLDTPWGERDLLMIRELAPAAVVLPKAEDPRVVAKAATMVATALMLMIETAKGVLAAEELAQSPGVEGLLFGAADYRESLRAGRTPDESELAFARAQILHASRAAGKEAFDTPWFEYKDHEGLERSAKRVRLMGFDGKAAIHPSQVPKINEIFSPTGEEVERAKQVVAVMEQALSEGRNVATLGNEMIEALHLKEARRILARAATSS